MTDHVRGFLPAAIELDVATSCLIDWPLYVKAEMAFGYWKLKTIQVANESDLAFPLYLLPVSQYTMLLECQDHVFRWDVSRFHEEIFTLQFPEGFSRF